MKVKELPSQEYLSELFYYDNGLKWRIDKKIGRLAAKAGEDVIENLISGGDWYDPNHGI